MGLDKTALIIALKALKTAEQGGGGGGCSLFMCEYGVTTGAEIGAALAAGKLPVVYWFGSPYIYSNLDSGGYHFYSIKQGYDSTSGASGALDRVDCSEVSAIWSFGGISLAPLHSAKLTGVPTAPTAPAGTNTTQIATTAFVKAAIDAIPVATGVSF